jgi:hypothetical protein
MFDYMMTKEQNETPRRKQRGVSFLIAICLIVVAIPCKAQDETKHIAVFNQQWLVVSIEDIDT